MRSSTLACLFLVLSILPTVASDVIAPAAIARNVRIDPYKTFKFRVVMEGRAVAGFSQVSGLPNDSKVGRPRSTPPLMLYQGVTRDNAFEKWISATSNTVRRVQRKDITIVLQDETGRAVRRYKFLHAWPSKYQGAPNLDANANEVAIATLTLENEGVEIE